MTVEPGGHLDMGTEASPVPAGVNAHLVLALGQSAGQYGLIVEDGGDFTVRGATKAPDYCFRVGGTRKFFLEAKKPSVHIKEDVAASFQLR